MGESDAQRLIQQATLGDQQARQALLVLHRDRLCRLIRARMDGRLSRRIDPSDVVQESLVDAAAELSAYLRNPQLPFYPWLRQIACRRLIDLHRRHIRAHKRSLNREEYLDEVLPNASVAILAQRLVATGSSPSGATVKQESAAQVRRALTRLSPPDRRVLVLRFLEQLSTKETAAVVGVSDAAIRMRQLRALQRLRSLLSQQFPEAT